MSPAKWNALERSAADLYRRAVRTEMTMREASMTSAMAITTNTYQLVSTVCSPLTNWLIASVTMKRPPPIRIAASPSAPRFSARRCP